MKTLFVHRLYLVKKNIPEQNYTNKQILKYQQVIDIKKKIRNSMNLKSLLDTNLCNKQNVC